MTTAITTCALSVALPLLLIAAFNRLAARRDARRSTSVWRGADEFLAALERGRR